MQHYFFHQTKNRGSSGTFFNRAFVIPAHEKALWRPQRGYRINPTSNKTFPLLCQTFLGKKNTAMGIKHSPRIGVIHKPRGQIFGYFWPPSWPLLLNKAYVRNKMVIWLTPSPSTVHVVYGCPLTKFEMRFSVQPRIVISRGGGLRLT